MDNLQFQNNISRIIADGFTSKGLNLLEYYGELFTTGMCLFKRFSPQEQHGCTAGGSTHVIATILAGAETPANYATEGLSDFKKELLPELIPGGVRGYTCEVEFAGD